MNAADWLLQAIVNEFGRSSFSKEEVIETLEDLTSEKEPPGTAMNVDVGSTFDRLYKGGYIEPLSRHDFEVSETGHERFEDLTTEEKPAYLADEDEWN